MDTVITCHCGSQTWVIGTGGIRCSDCHGFLPDDYKLDVDAANEWLEETTPED